ncbi:hypothetical protein P7K49_020665 [Saguinus oedipus]|uniref:Uncharacterized protein n=1 Tax=Saguinus oedipus TaxID=9490 RepID=A0ABQ9V2R5_SAGOE|nr:hypothetical protein P7K49_020665 [Saguinus oedipus]
MHRFWRGLPLHLDSVDAVYERTSDHKIVFFKGGRASPSHCGPPGPPPASLTGSSLHPAVWKPHVCPEAGPAPSLFACALSRCTCTLSCGSRCRHLEGERGKPCRRPRRAQSSPKSGGRDFCAVQGGQKGRAMGRSLYGDAEQAETRNGVQVRGAAARGRSSPAEHITDGPGGGWGRSVRGRGCCSQAPLRRASLCPPFQERPRGGAVGSIPRASKAP